MHKKVALNRIAWFVIVLSLVGAIALSPAAEAQDYTIDPPVNVAPILPSPDSSTSSSGGSLGTTGDEVLGVSITASAAADAAAAADLAAAAAQTGGAGELALTGSSVQVPLAAGAGLITLGSLLLMVAARGREDT